MAYGVLFAGTSFAGLFFPLLLPRLFSRYGTAETLRYLSVVLAVCTAAALALIKPRLPVQRVRGPSRGGMWGLRVRGSARGEDGLGRQGWVRDWSLWLLLLANTLQGFAYYVPIVWLPSWFSSSSIVKGKDYIFTAFFPTQRSLLH